MAYHRLEASVDTLHGYFSPELAPVLTIDAGDTVEFTTLDAGWGLEQRTTIHGPRRVITPKRGQLERGHALTGPVAIRGAQPGMTLAITVEAINVGPYGWTVGGGWSNGVNELLGVAEGEGVIHQWTLDRAAGFARNQHGHLVALRPFMGVMGVAPGEAGIHSTIPPRVVGGNIDCRELIAGSTLFLPVAAPGALFSTGDGHAAQGDGESSGTAIECPMDRVVLRFELRDDLRLTAPSASTAAGWITMGFDADLDLATAAALNGMLDHLIAEYGVARADALVLASVAVDLHVTQIVNGVRGVHAILPPDAIRLS